MKMKSVGWSLILILLVLLFAGVPSIVIVQKVAKNEDREFKDTFNVEVPRSEAERDAILPIVNQKLRDMIWSNSLLSAEIAVSMTNLQSRLYLLPANASNVVARTALFQQIYDLRSQQEKSAQEFQDSFHDASYAAWCCGFKYSDLYGYVSNN